MYRHTPRTSKFFTLYGQSALKSRPMKRSAGTNLPRPDTFPFFQDTFSTSTYIRSHVHIHAEPPWTIIKKIEGERSLLIRLANCDTSPSRTQARYWIPSFFKRNRVVLHLSPFLHVRPISESLSARDRRCHYFCPVNGTWTYVSLYVLGWLTSEGRRGVSTPPQKWNTFTTMAFRFSFVESAKWILRCRKCFDARLLA